MVDAERLHRILRRIADDLAKLRAYAEAPRRELLADPARMGHVKYLFVTAIEGCIDAGQHVCASEGWGPPDTNAGAMVVLADHGTLSPAQGRRLADAVRFRNLLVHGYAQVDEQRVASHLDQLDDLAEFVAALSRLVDEAS